MRKSIGSLSLLLLTACSDGYFQEVQAVTSPSGKQVAAQYHIGAGPISADKWEIRIRSSESAPRADKRLGCVAWVSSAVGVQSIVWETETTLKLGVPDVPRAHAYEHTFKPKGCSGVSVAWQYVPRVEP